MRRYINYWLVIAVFFMVGLTYLAVPLYQILCQVTGMGGTPKESDAVDSVIFMDDEFVENRFLTIHFTGDVSATMPWKFEPMQQELKVMVGETALAFFKATNCSPNTIVGISTYNVNPPAAGIYFNKIQCFCFEEQRLKKMETIDMPVFFYLDPEFLEDPNMHNIKDISLSYTFFKVDEY